MKEPFSEIKISFSNPQLYNQILYREIFYFAPLALKYFCGINPRAVPGANG